jgi:hypothetical protein
LTNTQIGQHQFGNLQFNGSYEIEAEINTPNSEGYFHTQIGFDQFGKRRYLYPEQWQPTVISDSDFLFPEIIFVTHESELLGHIRTDIDKCILVDLNFKLDSNGCNNFKLILNSEPDFEIIPFCVMKVRLDNTKFWWYSGEVQYIPEIGTQKETFVYTGFGLNRYLKTIKGGADYAAGLDVGEVVDSIIQNIVEPETPINYNPTKIETSTGVILANQIELGKFFLDKVLNTLGDMASYDWGVDGDMDFFFIERDDTTVNKTFFIGYDLNQFDPEINYNEIKNAIMVRRQEGKGSGGAGWEVAGLYNDETSIAKYGRKELDYQIPGFFDDTDADIVGNAKLAELKDPQISGKINGYRIRSKLDYLDPGLYRFIMPFSRYSELLNDLDDSTEFSVFNILEYLDADWVWSELNPTSAPSARDYYAMAIDDSSGIAYLFGGNDGARSDETWSYGIVLNDWIDLNPVAKPTARQFISMVYYSGKLYLFGGNTAAGNSSETLEYDIAGNAWASLAPATAPSARNGVIMAGDPNNPKIYLYGGSPNNTETWEYDITGNDWTNLNPATNLGNRAYSEMVYYSGKFYLFGGYNGAIAKNDLWVYDIAGNDWSELSPPGDIPPARWGHGMDIFDDKLFVFGGWSGAARLGDTWYYDISENTWTELTISPSLSARYGIKLKNYDDEFYLFGGNTSGGRTDETWKLDNLALGDLTVTDESDIFIWADGSIKFNFKTADGDYATLPIDFQGNIKTIKFYCRSDRSGNYATVGIGQTSWNEYTTDLDIPLYNDWFLFKWDISNLGIDNIQRFGIRIDDNQLSGTNIYIDKLSVEIDGNKTYNLILKMHDYDFNPSKQSVNAEFGILKPKMENYIAALFSAASELKFTGEIR